MRRRYKLTAYFETEEVFETPEDVLADSWLYTPDFRGVVTSAQLVERK